jgi:hypothetical protein
MVIQEDIWNGNVIVGLFAQNRQKLHVKLTVFGVLSIYSISFEALISDLKKTLITNCVLEVNMAFFLNILFGFVFLCETFKVSIASDSPDFPIFDLF